MSARVGVVIPAFRAETTIAAVLRGLPALVERVFVVDDASPDATAAAAAAVGDPRVQVIRHERNRGVGGAMKTGYAAALEAGCDVVVKMDADGQMDPLALPELLRPLVSGDAGYTKGNRLHSLEASRAMPRERFFGNLFLSMATKLVSGYWNVLDPTNGFTAIRADVLRRLDLRRVEERYFFETSMLVELHLLRVPVRDVLMSARYAGETSSMRLVPIAFEFAPRLAVALLRRLTLEYVVMDFHPGAVFALAGVFLTAFGGSFGAYHWYESVVTGKEATAGTVMLAALPLLVGIQLLLQAVVLDIGEVRNFAPLPPLE